MNKMVKPILFSSLIFQVMMAFAQPETQKTIIPQPYEKALKNPLMGFTTINVDDHPWASVLPTYPSQINIYNILGKKVESAKCYGNTCEIQTKGFISGVYLIHVFEKEGSLKVVKIIITNNQY
jgi:hypothetical protein